MKRFLMTLTILVALTALASCSWRRAGNNAPLEQQLTRAAELNKIGDYQGALVCLNEAHILAPDAPGILVRRASVRAELNDLSGGMTDLGKALELDSEYVTAYIARGILRRKMNDLNGSLEDLNRAVELAPRLGEAFLVRGSTKMEKGDLAGAIEDFTIAMNRDPNLYRAYLLRAYAYIANGREDLALRDAMYVRKNTKDQLLRERAKTLMSDLLLSQPSTTE